MSPTSNSVAFRFDARISFWLFLLAGCIFVRANEHVFFQPKLLVCALLVAFLAFRYPARFAPAWLLVALWPVASWLLAVHHWDFLRGLQQPLLFFFTVLCVGPLPEDVKQGLRRALALVAVATTAYLLLQSRGLDPFRWEVGSAAGSFFGNPNFSAHVLLLALCLGDFGKGRLVFAGRCFLLLGIVFCRSRGVWLGVLIWFAFTYRQIDPIWRRVALVLVGLLVFVGLWWGRGELGRGWRYVSQPERYLREYREQPVTHLFRDAWYRGKRQSLMTRYLMWRNSLSLIGDHPLLGVGAGQFRTAYPAYSDAYLDDINLSELYRPASPHNLFLSLAAQFGLLWLGGVLVFAWRALRRHPPPKPFLVALLLQLGLAMVSLNDQNPLIYLSLYLLYPRAGEQGGKVTRWLGWLPLMLILPVFLLDLLARPPLRQDGDLERALFPELVAPFYYDQADYSQAWRAQLLALAQDPNGPDVLYNLGIIARARFERGDGELWFELALRCQHMLMDRFPFYSHAPDQLERMRYRHGRLPVPEEAASTTRFFSLLDRLRDK